MKNTITTFEAEARLNKIKKQRENAKKTIYKTIVSLVKAYGKNGYKDIYTFGLNGYRDVKAYNKYRDTYTTIDFIEVAPNAYPEEYDGEKWGITAYTSLHHDDGETYGYSSLGKDYSREELLQCIIETIEKF